MREKNKETNKRVHKMTTFSLDILKKYTTLYHTYPLFCCKGHIQIRNDHNTMNMDTKSNGINKHTTMHLMQIEFISHLLAIIS